MDEGPALLSYAPLSATNDAGASETTVSTTTNRAFATLCIAALITGCGSDSSTAPPSDTPLDLAAVFSQMSMGNVNAIPGAASAMAAPVTAVPPAFTPTSCTY